VSNQPLAIEPAEFVRLIRATSDKDLANGLRANREALLGEIFSRMAEHVRPDRVGDLDVVIEWQITDPDGGEPARWQLVIARGSASVEREGTREPSVSLRLDGVRFMRLISEQVSGPQLFVTGKLKIRGNLMVAARLPSVFAFPG
jgi:putative sterol carrier protein